MKTIILYASHHGATREIAQRIANNLDDCTIHDLKQNSKPSLDDVDCVIIGSPVYAGIIHRNVRRFLARNKDRLLEVKLALFLSGMQPSQQKEYFSSHFSPELLHHAVAASFLGGIYDPQNVGKVNRFIMKVVARMDEYDNTINDVKIKRFIEMILKSSK